GALRYKAGDEQRKGRKYDNYGRYPRIDRKHEANGAGNSDHAAEKLGKSHQKAVRNLVHIRDHPAEDITMLVGIYELERNVVQAFESLYPHIPGGIIRSPVVAKPHEP